jgi:uncharacterized membrane protein
MLDRGFLPNVGVYVYGAAAAAAGIINLVWGDFATGWQPIQAFGDHVPGRELYAYITAVWLIAGGAAILWRRTARAGAVALSIVYFIFGFFWMPRFYWVITILGFRIPSLIGVVGGLAQQLMLVAAAAIVYASMARLDSSRLRRIGLIARRTFGLCAVGFGLNHLTSVGPVAVLVPKWMPGGGNFWAALTGIAFLLAGIAIVSEIQEVLAARLLALMLLVFSVLVLVPQIFASPHDHEAWGGNAYNLAAVAATWIVADSLAGRRREAQNQKNGVP